MAMALESVEVVERRRWLLPTLQTLCSKRISHVVSALGAVVAVVHHLPQLLHGGVAGGARRAVCGAPQVGPGRGTAREGWAPVQISLTSLVLKVELHRFCGEGSVGCRRWGHCGDIADRALPCAVGTTRRHHAGHVAGYFTYH